MPDAPRDRGLHRHNNPPQGDEQPAVTGRANDLGNRGVDRPALGNSTLASRAAERRGEDPPDLPALAPAGPNSTLADRAKARQAKKVGADDVEDKAVTKAPAKKAAARKG